jgi:hypothetical protein
VRPTEFNLLAWDDKTRGLRVKRDFSIFDRFVPPVDADTLPTQYESGPVRPFTIDDTTWLLAPVFGPHAVSHVGVLRMKDDSLAASLTTFRDLPVPGLLFLNLDGKGIGLLTLNGAEFRFYRL